ncbi:MAG: hypothetical protein WBQ72_05485 [Terriglobales bacterium]|jgi:hypothetical protein
MDELSHAIARLDARLESLERRILALEACAPRSNVVVLPVSSQPANAPHEFALPQAGGFFPIAGKAMLGIAGAYLLRAVAESGSFPMLAIAVLAMAYAAAWLVWAARTPGSLASTAYAATSALILVPMLGELTLRSQVLPAPATAALLSAFVSAALLLAWKRNLTSLVWIAEVATVFAALSLLILSHDLVPYTAALLVAAAVSEIAAATDRWRRLRFLVAPAADIAAAILIYIHSLPETSRPGYATVSNSVLLALPSALFFIYGASFAWRTIWRRRQTTFFEIAQSIITFTLALFTWLWFYPAAGRFGAGAFCWLLCAACYAAAFVVFDRIAEQRNYHVYATYSAALLLAGSFLLLPSFYVALFLTACSVVATLVGLKVSRLTPEFHGLLYLTVAAYACGLLQYAGQALAGTFPTAPGWSVWIVAIAAVFCYAIGGRFAGERWNERLLRLLAAILAVSAVATFLVSCMVWLAAIGMTPGASHVAVIRTLITCGLSLALAALGSRWKRNELVWTAYGTLALVSAKLLFEDLPHGHSGSIAISISLYALALIMVPRVARMGR